MSLARRYPIIGLIAGLVLIAAGIIRGEIALWIVGIVLIAVTAARRVRS